MHLDASQLAAGRLGALFREGAIGVVIKGDPRIQKAWEMLLPRMKAANAGEERLPWEAPVVDMARNLYSDGGLNCTGDVRSEEHTSELQSLMRISYAVFCLKKKNTEKERT